MRPKPVQDVVPVSTTGAATAAKATKEATAGSTPAPETRRPANRRLRRSSRNPAAATTTASAPAEGASQVIEVPSVQTETASAKPTGRTSTPDSAPPLRRRTTTPDPPHTPSNSSGNSSKALRNSPVISILGGAVAGGRGRAAIG